MNYDNLKSFRSNIEFENSKNPKIQKSLNSMLNLKHFNLFTFYEKIDFFTGSLYVLIICCRKYIYT